MMCCCRLSFGLLDYRHHALVNLEKCVETLLLVCRNVVDEPESEKFRRVRPSLVATVSTLANIVYSYSIMS